MKRTIPHSMPFVGNEERIACARVIRRKQLGQNGEVKLLENELASSVSHRYGAAVSSGTAALYCALRALGVTQKDSVLIPSYVCTALFNAVHSIGAKPVLADVDPQSGNMTADTVKRALRKNVRAVIVPHLFGHPADIAGIAHCGVPVIEDCAQCVGAQINGQAVGGLSPVSVFSFYATKLIGAGEGGMVASSDAKTIAAVIALREYDNRETLAPAFNFKMSDLQAAVTRAQLKKLSPMIKKRRLLARYYRLLLADQSPLITMPPQDPLAAPVYFRFVIRCASASLRDEIICAMGDAGVSCAKPVFRPLHRYLGLPGFPGADLIHDRAVSLPLYPGLDKKDVEYIAGCLIKIVERRRQY